MVQRERKKEKRKEYGLRVEKGKRVQRKMKKRREKL